MLLLCPQWSPGPYISRNLLIWTHFVNASWKKIGPTHANFQYKARKLMSLKSVLLWGKRYSSRKLSNGKVITTACNIWRQIACSFQVMSRNILILGKKKYLKSPHFLKPGQGIWAKKFTHTQYVFPPWKSLCDLSCPPKTGREWARERRSRRVSRWRHSSW